jgi:hypothetical protein
MSNSPVARTGFFALPETIDRPYLRSLADAELKAAHRQAQVDCVLRRVRDALERLSAIELELSARRMRLA